MPLVRISVFEKTDAETRKTLAAAMYDAMRSTLGIPENDRFVVLTAHPQEELTIDPHFMNAQRTEDFVLVHVTLRRGRSVETKQSFYKEVARLFEERASIAPVLTTNVPGTAGGRIHSPSAVRTSSPGKADWARKVRKLLSVGGAKPNSWSPGSVCGG